MKEVFTMWRYTQMVVLVALSAAIYAAVLIPFKGFPLVPGYIEIRPANAFPVVFGLLFGPAGAWGAAIGNLIGDFFGTLPIAGGVGARVRAGGGVGGGDRKPERRLLRHPDHRERRWFRGELLSRSAAVQDMEH